ncbi:MULTISPECIES: hypothetical protein [Bacillus]|uniref:hypothetical protein n=1 Tax=Bacillus TaxID=1386 RepID=UPI0013BEB080|nr:MULTISPECIES: hypothetical protein [Bacillus]QID51022.1 hypothetical protein G4O42_13085 [Bacillus sp. LUNF1]WLI79796.1 hypothetical protein Q8A65_13205 [Bacillus velezensis]
MKNHFQFGDLIEKYSVDFTLLLPASEGFYDDLGKWVEGQPVESEEKGAIVPLQAQLIYQSGGRLTQMDRQLYFQKKIPFKAQVVFDGVTFLVEAMTPYETYADFNSYILKAVSNSDGLQQHNQNGSQND